MTLRTIPRKAPRGIPIRRGGKTIKNTDGDPDIKIELMCTFK